jgi:hypothetical protein
MSPHSVNNFVTDLVQMAQAVEELPKVQAALDDARHVLSEMDKQVEGLRADLQQAKDYAATLEQKVRDTEVAKDQAETMFLEADERTSRALDFIKATFGNAGTLIQALEPPKPESKVEAKPEPMPMALPSGGWHNDEIITPAQGQSEPGPTSAPSVSHTEHVSETPSVSSNEPSWATPSPQPDTPPTTKPYEGKHYKDMPQYINYYDWIAGGGTDYNYYY